MKNYSKAWYDALAVERFTQTWPSVYGPRAPIMPFIALPLPPEVRGHFREAGELHHFQPGDSIIEGTVVKGMQMIVSGLSCRVAATLDGQSGAGAMGLSTPNRVATGNLNFATRRPQIGQYFALSKVTTLRIAHARADELGYLKDPLIIRLWLSIQELINLSDRMGLTITAILPAQQKFAAFLLAWAVYFGTVEEGPRGQRVRIPIPGRARHIATVISVSDVTLDKLFADCRSRAGLEREGDFLVFDSAYLQEAHDWMRYCDGNDSPYTRPARISDSISRPEPSIRRRASSSARKRSTLNSSAGPRMRACTRRRGATPSWPPPTPRSISWRFRATATA